MKKLSVLLLLLIFTGCSLKQTTTPTSTAQPQTKSAVTTLPPQTIIPTKNQITVGVLLPFSGNYKDISNSILESILLSYSANSTKKIVIKVYDTNENGKDTAKQAAQNAISAGVDIIIGPLLTTSLNEITPVTEDKNIPVIALSNDRTALVDTKNVYIMGYSPEEEVERIVDYVISTKNAHNFAALIPENKYGEIVLADLKATLAARGAELTKVVTYPPDEINFTSYAEQLIDPQDLSDYHKALDAYTAQGGNKYRSLTSNTNDRPQPKLNFDTLFIGDFGKRLILVGVHLPFVDIDTSKINLIGTRLWASAPIANESVFNGALYPDLPDINATIFASKFQSIYKKQATLIDVIAYNALQMVADLITVDPQTGNLKYDFSKAALTSYTGFGVLGNYNLRNDGLSQHDLLIKQVNNRSISTVDQTSSYDYMKVSNYQDVVNTTLTKDNSQDDQNSSNSAPNSASDEDEENSTPNTGDQAQDANNDDSSATANPTTENSIGGVILPPLTKNKIAPATTTIP
ncbi:penicillin-binding protein activator [Rickettsiales bacterium LUAb2]